MFEKLFNQAPKSDQAVEISMDPRPGVQTLSPSEISRWLEGGVEVIDLGTVNRDEVIQPTTWHAES